MTTDERTVELLQVLDLMYSTLDTIQAAAECMMDTVAGERAALDTLAAPAAKALADHQMVMPGKHPEVIGPVGPLGNGDHDVPTKEADP